MSTPTPHNPSQVAEPEVAAPGPQERPTVGSRLSGRGPVGLLLLVATLAYCSLWWPGHMSSDFLTMYGSALNSTPGDFHSPGFVLLFELLLPLGAGPGWVLFAQLGGLMLGLFLVLRVRFARLPAAGLAILLLGTPMALGMGGSLSRDVWFAEAMLLTVALATAIHRHERLAVKRVLTGLAALAILAMLLSRQNGLFSVGPAGLAVYAAWRPDVLDSWRKILSVLVGGTLAAGVLLLTMQAAMYRLADVERQHPETALYLYDITAMHSLGADVELPPSVRNVPMDQVAKSFTPVGMSGLVWSANPPARFPGNDAERDDLSSAWRSAILEHPYTWWRARMRLYLSQTALNDRAIFIYHPQLDPNTLGLATRWPGLEKHANNYVRAFALPDFRGSALFDIWLYLAIAGVAVVKLWRRRGTWRIAALLGVGSLTYQVGLFALVPVAEYRFQYASVVAGLALLALIAGPSRPRAASPK